VQDNNFKTALLFSHRDFFCTLAYRVAHLCELRQNALLKQYGVTHQQTQLLAYIYARPSLTVVQKDLEVALKLKSSSVTQQLNILERAGLILRVPCNLDRRAKRLVVTEKAAALHEAFLGSLLAVDKAMCDGLDEGEKKQLHKLLLKAYENLEII